MEKNKKGRLIYLLKLLYEHTDEEHVISTNEIITYFKGIDISVNRKTVKDDIDVLVDAGLDVVTVKSSHNSFYLRDRKFEISELKLLVDAVSSSKFITRDKSEELITKLSTMVSKGQSEKLVRHLYIAGRVKPNNEQIYNIVDEITDAINSRKKIQFQYIDYTIEKKKVLKNKGELYINSPYALVWNEDRYYLIGYSDKHEKLVQFRVDRMYRPKITSADAVPEPAGFNAAEYTRKVFEMYDGEESLVVLECTNDLMKVIIDRFGEAVNVQKCTASTFTFRINICLSPTFYGWIFQFVGKVRIVAPLVVKSEYQNMVKRVLECMDNAE